VALRSDDMQVSSVYLAPDRTSLDFTVEDGYVRTTVPEVHGYAVVVFEES
jgi:hypothetical protein